MLPNKSRLTVSQELRHSLVHSDDLACHVENDDGVSDTFKDRLHLLFGL